MSIEVAQRKQGNVWPIMWKSTLIAVVLFVLGVTVIFRTAVLQLILPDQTVYASGFSGQLFAQVRPGMGEQQVLSILGPPLDVTVEPESHQTYRRAWNDRPADRSGVRRLWWDYSRAGRFYDSYNVRSVELNAAGKVVAVDHHFYQD